MNKTIGIIGFGNMGSAIAERLKKDCEVTVFDKDKNKTKGLVSIKVAGDISGLAEGVDTIVLAVKPQDFELVLDEMKDNAKDKLIISIAAGITTAYIERRMTDARVIRTMPNLPARVGAGITCVCKGASATEEDLDFAKSLFDVLGETLVLNDEDMMSAATAVSGSGPGFLFSLVQGKKGKELEKFATDVFSPKLEKVARDEGFDSDQAHVLSVATTAGSLELLAVPGNSAETLRVMVISAGGTTEAGLKVLQNNLENLPEAIKAARKRAQELSKG